MNAFSMLRRRSATVLAAGMAAVVVALTASQASAQTTYYWDNTSPMSTTGFGTAGGTWGTDAFWSTSNTGVNASGTLTTGTADTANFGTNTASYGLASGTVGVNGTVNIGSIVSGSQSGAITLGSSVSSGTITLGAAGGSIRNNSGSVLTINSDIVITVSSPSYRDILGTGTVVLNGSTSGGGYWRVNSGATLVLKNSSSVGLGFNTGGTILVGASNLTWGTLSAAAGGTLDLNGYDFTVGNMQWAAGTITDNSAGSGTTTLTNNAVNTMTFGGLIADGASKKLAFAYNGSLPLTLSNANTFSGNTKLVAGTVRLGNSLALQNSAIDTSGAGVISLAYATGTTTTPTIGGLIGSKNLSSVITGSYALMTALTLNTVSGQNLTYSGTIAEGAAGMTLTKSGAGTQTLSATNTYTGATSITAGQLQIGSAGSINTSSGITINGTTAEFKYNAATALTKPITFTAGTISGTGTIGTAVTVGTRDILSPGNSPGSQSFTSGLTFAPGGKYVWEINNWAGSPGTNYDQLVVSGSALNITATSGSAFTIALTSLTSGNVAGAVPGFSPGTTGTTFAIATSSAGITGFDKGKFSIDQSAFTNNNTLPTNAGFWLSTNGGSTSLILNYAPSATYNLSVAASAAAIRVGGTSTITATVTSSTASVTNPDSLSYAGLALSGGLGTLSSTSGTLAGGATSSGSAAFTTLGTGSYTFNPSLTSATNVNIGTSANPGTTSGVTVSVYNPASATSLTGTTVVLTNVHVGQSFGTQSLSISNTGTAAAAFQEGLAGSYTSAAGAASGSGSFANLFTGSASTAISVGLGNASTATAGVKSGTVTLGFTSTGTTSSGATGLNPLALASQTVAVTGTVFNYAAATIASGTTINLGTVLTGTPLSQTLSITNSAPNDGYSEKLDAAFGAITGGATTNSGSFSLLVAGGTNASSMTVGLGSSTAGDKSGTVQLNFTSNGLGTSGLGTASIGSQTVSLAATVLDPATALLVGGSTSGSNWILNLGEFQQGSGTSSAVSFGISNLTQTAGFTADLFLASFANPTNSGAIFTDLTGTSSFATLASGSTNPFTAWMSLATTGTFTNIYNLSFNSSKNGTSLGGSPQNVTLTVTGIIVVPEPGALALAGIGIGIAGWLVRRRQK